jgi:opacity protein-like surface antigen
MLKQILIFCFLIGMTHLAQAQHLQLMENRGEIGLFAGQSSYRGDIAPDIFTFNNNFGAFYKKQYNDYAGFRLNYEMVQLSNDDLLSNNVYANSRKFFFSRNFHDISLMGEFYFTRFLPGNKAYRFSPYLGIGAGYMFELGEEESNPLTTLTVQKSFFNFPIQLGFKFNLTQHWNLFTEASYRFSATDELDYLIDGQLYSSPGASAIKYQGSRSGKDQFFSVKGGISYSLIKIYGEEKFKPGKRSKSNRGKNQETSQDKPGFFSRLKFKRK